MEATEDIFWHCLETSSIPEDTTFETVLKLSLIFNEKKKKLADVLEKYIEDHYDDLADDREDLYSGYGSDRQDIERLSEICIRDGKYTYELMLNTPFSNHAYYVLVGWEGPIESEKESIYMYSSYGVSCGNSSHYYLDFPEIEKSARDNPVWKDMVHAWVDMR